MIPIFYREGDEVWLKSSDEMGGEAEFGCSFPRQRATLCEDVTEENSDCFCVIIREEDRTPDDSRGDTECGLDHILGPVNE
jgi:hypothetical protein